MLLASFDTRALLLGMSATIAAGVLWAMIGMVFSHTARYKLDILSLMTVFGVLSMFLAWGEWGYHVYQRTISPSATSRVWEMGLLLFGSGVLDVASVLSVQKAMQIGHHGAVWTISKSCFIVPFLTGVVLFSEPAAPFQIAGFATIIASVMVFGLDSAGA